MSPQTTAPTVDVLALGNAIMDVLAFADDSFITDEGMAKGCMMLIDEARALKLQQVMQNQKLVAGGSAANTLVAMAELGAKTHFIGKVRNDSMGDNYRAGMQASGVVFPTPEQSFGPATACCYILVTPDGQRTMNTFLGVCSEVREDDVEEGRRGRIRHHLCGRLFVGPTRSQRRPSLQSGAHCQRAWPQNRPHLVRFVLRGTPPR